MKSRLDNYFKKYVDEFVFLELMPEFVKRERLDFMRKVPMPVKKEHLKELSEEGSIKFKYFTDGMTDILGIDPEFKYRTQYITFLRYINKNIVQAIAVSAVKEAQDGKLVHAAIMLRGALAIDSYDPDALYNYMLVCRNLYVTFDDKQKVSDFKSEVFELLELLEEVKPDFPMTYYYLGYAHVNAGRYAEAERAWKKFTMLSEPCEELDEIKERISDLAVPVHIEEGYRNVIAGNYEKGLEILSQYKDNESLQKWWPLNYYLGVANSRIGKYDQAIEYFKKALKEAPSSIEILQEMTIAYNAVSDEVNAEKYMKKIEMVKKNQEKDKDVWD